MRAVRLLFSFLIVSTGTAFGWNTEWQYEYLMESRTLTSLFQIAPQYSGVLTKANITIIPRDATHLLLKISNFRLSEVHANLTRGWQSDIPEQLDFQPVPFNVSIVELEVNKGIIKNIQLDRSIGNAEINIVKGIVSQLQVDLSGVNAKRTSSNQMPSDDNPVGSFKTIEDTVTGKCETIYDVSALPEYLLQSNPQLAPVNNISQSGTVWNIIKTQNYSECQQRMSYNFGIPGKTQWEAGASKMGQFLSRTNVGRVVVTGTIDDYTIQSSVTTNKIVLSPHIYNKQKGMVVSKMNLTLVAVGSKSEAELPASSDTQTISSLVYSFNKATADGALDIEYDPKKDASMIQTSNESQDRPKPARFSFFGSKTPEEQPKPKPDSSSSSSESDSSSGSSEEYLQPRTDLSQAPNIPFLSYFIGNQGYSIQSDKRVNLNETISRLASQVANEVRNPGVITGSGTLSKFTILVRLLRTLNFEQLANMSKDIYFSEADIANSNAGLHKQYVWKVFRDAVAESGTGPALQLIQQWVNENKVEKFEAAQLISTLTKSARYPTSQYLGTLYSLVTGRLSQEHMNTTALLAFSNLVHKVLVNKQASHNYYPVHSFGYLARKNDSSVTQQYIPYFKQALEEAIDAQNSRSIQLYIKVLANIAHPQVLDVFQPYLNGSKPLTKFSRLTILVGLGKMADMYPKKMRPVYYRIYQNLEECTELRSVAAMMLFKTQPPLEMLQRMAEFTNEDPNGQVSSLVKSSIENMAKQNGPEAINARSAAALLNKKRYSSAFTTSYSKSNQVQDEDLSYSGLLTYIQSKDSIVPSSVFMDLKKTMGGLQLPVKTSHMMTSSSSILWNILVDQYENGDSQDSDLVPTVDNSTWTTDTIAKMINLQTEPVQQLEGQILFNWLGSSHLLTFDNSTFEQLPQVLDDLEMALKQGRNYEYMKLYNQFSMDVAVPTVSGWPFFYSINIPAVVRMSGQVKGELLQDHKNNATRKYQSAYLNTNLDLAYSLKTESSHGFIVPLTHKEYLSVVERNTHIQLPVNLSLATNVSQKKVHVSLEPQQLDQQSKLFEYSTYMFTTKSDINSVSPLAQDKNSRPLFVRSPYTMQQTIGDQSTGFAFKLTAHTQEEELSWPAFWRALAKHDWITALIYPYSENKLKNNNYTLVFDPKQSTATQAKFTFELDKVTALSQVTKTLKASKLRQGSSHKFTEQEASNWDYRAERVPDRKSKSKNKPNDLNLMQQRFLNNIRPESSSTALKVTARFEGRTQSSLDFLYIHSSNQIQKTSQCFSTFNFTPAVPTPQNSAYQAGMTIELTRLATPTINYNEALQDNTSAQVNAQFTLEDSDRGYINIQGELKRSDERKDFIEQLENSKLCEKQMLKGNYILPPCQRAVLAASRMNEFNFNIKYANVHDELKNASSKVYDWIKYFGFNYLDEALETVSGDRVVGQIKLRSDLKSANMSLAGRTNSLKLKNLPVGQPLQTILALSPHVNILEHLALEGAQLSQAVCSLDTNFTTTLDQKSYPINIGKCWHVALQTVHGGGYLRVEPEELSVLIRDGDSKRKEVKLVIENEVINIVPTGDRNSPFKISVNEDTLKLTDSEVLVLNGQNSELGQAYWSSSKLLEVKLPSHGITIVHDGTRLQIKVSNWQRGQVRGLCGTFTTDTTTDFTTPMNCILSNPFEFAATYAVVDSTCQGYSKQMRSVIHNVVCKREEEVDKVGQVDTDVEILSSQSMWSNSCTELKVKVIEDEGRYCFSIRPHIECNKPCAPSALIKKQIDFHCIKDVEASRYWQQTIQKGVRLNFGKFGANKRVSIELPKSCIEK